MAAAGASSGVPLQLLHEAESHTVTIELKSGEAYRGVLLEAEDTMNCQLTQGKSTALRNGVYHSSYHFAAVTMTSRDGRISKLEHVFLRGGQIKFIVLPELLKSAPMFKKVQALKAKKVETATKTATKSSKPPAKIRRLA